MKPSSLSTRAISTFIFEAGTVQVRWLAAFALRIRVSMSAMVSLVIVAFLPGGLLDAGDLAHGGVLTEADAAHAELAHVGARAAADAAAVVLLDPVLRRPQRLGDQGLLCQLCLYLTMPYRRAFSGDARWSLRCLLPRLAEGHVEVGEERAPLVVGPGGGDHADLHAAQAVDLVVVDLREHQLLAEAEGVVAVA